MPQPIRRPCQVFLSDLTERPDHAAALGQVVTISGYLEALLGHLLAYLTGASASVTMAMFHSVTSTDAQRAMLNAAAELILEGAELEEFRDLMQEFRTRYGERSRLVHNVWGWSPDLPDKALWCKAQDATKFSSRLASLTAEEELDLFFQDDTMELWRMCSTYTVKEIGDVRDRLGAYTERVRLFVLQLQNQHPVIAARIAADQAAREAEEEEAPAADAASAPPAIEPPEDQPQDSDRL